MKKHSVDVCVVGGGPAGMVLALLLAKYGVKVLVLEKNKNFDREYRGEALMPRFTQMLRAIGLEEWLKKLPQLKLPYGEIFFGEFKVGKLDFSKAAPDTPYALWMPQPTLLQGLQEKAKELPTFDIWFGAHADSLIKTGEKVTGVRVKKGNEEFEVEARVTVGADGRYSTVVKDGGFEVEYEDYKFDILWFTIPKPKNYENTFKVLLSAGKSILLLPKFPDAIQAGILVAPHELAELRKEGIESLRQELKQKSSLFKDFASDLKDFTAFHPLQAQLFYMKEWAKDGCLLIGDSAHCCSPAGAIGVSIAVGTAIVAADVLVKALKETQGVLSKEILSQVQTLRDKDVRQVHSIQQRLTGGLLGSLLPIRIVLPFLVTLLARTPFFKRVQKQLMTLPEPLPISNGFGFQKA